MQNATHNALLDLVEEGVMDPMTVLRVALQWMGDDEVERMVNECPDFEGTGLQDDEDDEEDYDLEIITAPQYPPGKSEIISREARAKGLFLDEYNLHGLPREI